MDQVRKILTWLKEQHFWVLSVLICLIALYCWWSGAGAMSKAFQANKSQIEQGFTQLGGVQNEPFHPNEKVQEQQVQQTTKQAQNVAAIWERLYDRQREGVLVWPAALRKDFIDYIDKCEFGSNIDRKYRAVYQNYIQNHFPKLPESIHAKPISEVDAGAGGFSRGEMGPEGGMMMSPTGNPLLDDDDSLCEWDPADQAILRQQLDFQEQPSPLRVWITQEDLWCYQTLLNVISKTNTAANATRKSNAAVRVVHSLEVGQRAAPHSRTPGRIYNVPAAPAAGGGDPTLGGEFNDSGVSPEGGAVAGAPQMMFTPSFGGPGQEQMSPEQEEAALLTWRYLDADGKPMGGGVSDPNNPEAAPTGTTVDLEALKNAEFKQLPVRMVLRMDLRYLPQLIGQCADQPLQVEVQEVRIFPADSSNSAGGGLGGAAALGGSMGAGPGMFTGGSSSGPQTFDPAPHIATVVVQGVIYIFNPPNPDLLKSEADEQVVAAD